MTFLKYTYILFLLLMSASQLPTHVYSADLSISSSAKSSTDLLLNYIDNYKGQINDLFSTYEISNTEIIDAFNKNIDNIKGNIMLAVEDGTHTANYDQVISTSISSLKNINNRMKIYLDQEKIIYEQNIKRIQKKYDEIGKKIAPIIDEIIYSITNSLANKDRLNDEQKETVKSLVRLQEQNNKIKNFINLDFATQKQMKDYFRGIIISIREEIIFIKNNIS